MQVVPMTAELAMSMTDLEPVFDAVEIDARAAVELEEAGGYAVIDGDDVIALFGVLERWQGVGYGWCFLSRKWRRNARAITGGVIDWLDKARFHRIEIGVKVGEYRAHSWAQRLGFQMETPVARKWGPDMGDYSIYVRVS